MNTPVIVDAIRSPMARAKPDGALAQLHPVDLLSQVLEQLVQRNRIDPGAVDDVITGCVSQADRKSTRLNSSHTVISYAVFCLKKKKKCRRALCKRESSR